MQNVQETAGATPSGFDSLGLLPALLRAVAAEGYREPTPIQIQAIPPALTGRDLVACAQTGTGKTAAFLLPLLQHLATTRVAPSAGRPIRALVLAPTRELAAQIAERAVAYGTQTGITSALVYGGVGQRSQEIALAKRPELLVATPGRLLDLMSQRFVRLDAVEVFVLDEADRMLDMGFLPDVKRVISALPKRRQTMLFSATVPPPIAELSRSILIDPASVAVTPRATAAETVVQSVHFVASKAGKRALLEALLKKERPERTVVFARTKHGANRISEHLTAAGIPSAAIHGNKSQGARERALGGFREGTIPVLVATDIAARGIDVDGVSHVINYELPTVPETYVHRIGRTGRAGNSGTAISFCDPEERPLLADIERLLRVRIPLAATDGLPRETSAPASEQHHDARPDRGPRRDGRPRQDAGRSSDSRGPRPQPRATTSSSPNAGRPADGSGSAGGTTGAQPAETYRAKPRQAGRSFRSYS